MAFDLSFPLVEINKVAIAKHCSGRSFFASLVQQESLRNQGKVLANENRDYLQQLLCDRKCFGRVIQPDSGVRKSF
jgi:hypothetical protein